MTRQVLVIEDDDDIAKLVKLQLAELSCNVTLVSDGARGSPKPNRSSTTCSFSISCCREWTGWKSAGASAARIATRRC